MDIYIRTVQIMYVRFWRDILEFGALTEETGFYAGYKSSFQLWLEVINDKGIE